MYDYKKRRALTINKYQRTILRLSLLPTLAFSIMVTAVCVRFRVEALELMLYGTQLLTRQMIDQWFLVVVCAVWFFFAFVFFRSMRISADLVGSFERINRQLDKTIRGEMREPIRAREYDELAKELLQRINILIDNLPEGRLHVR